MSKRINNQKESNNKREYVINSLAFNSKKNILTTKEIVHCSECGKDNIISLNLNAESFKNISEEIKKEDLERIFQALAHVSPPKN